MCMYLLQAIKCESKQPLKFKKSLKLQQHKSVVMMIMMFEMLIVISVNVHEEDGVASLK